MRPALQRRIQRYGWDRAAGRYRSTWGAQIAPAVDRLLALADPRPGERVLDVACGDGLATLPVAEAVGPGGAVVGTDLSAEMVDRARAGAAAAGLRQVELRRMGAEALDFADGSFDAALCSLGLMYFPSPLAALGEMRRVLRPGGRAVVGVWGARERCGWAEIFPIVDARVETEVCPLFFQLGAGGSLAGALAAAGFVRVEVERLTTRLDYASGEEACAAAFAGGPVALAYSRFDEATRRQAHAEYLTSIAAWRNGDGYSIPGEFVVARGLRA